MTKKQPQQMAHRILPPHHITHSHRKTTTALDDNHARISLRSTWICSELGHSLVILVLVAWCPKSPKSQARWLQRRRRWAPSSAHHLATASSCFPAQTSRHASSSLWHGLWSSSDPGGDGWWHTTKFLQ